MEKILLKNVNDLVEASNNKEQVFVKYGNKFEPIDNSELYNQSDWLFTLKVLSGVTYFKMKKA